MTCRSIGWEDNRWGVAQLVLSNISFCPIPPHPNPLPVGERELFLRQAQDRLLFTASSPLGERNEVRGGSLERARINVTEH